LRLGRDDSQTTTFLAVLRRLAPYGRPVRGRLMGSGAAALGAMLAGLGIPLLIQRIVDGPVAHRDRATLVWLSLGVLGLGSRAISDPAVLVLAEATSSLDIPSEQAVQAALATVLSGRTALIIAHRLSTVLAADRVLVLADGLVIEDGSPAELITGTGAFATLHTAEHTALA
jgi:ABC-type multidrug transport system fused ATPase/permease subunit